MWLLIFLWNIIKQCSKALRARGEKSGNAIMLSLMSIWTTRSCHSSYVRFSPPGSWAPCRVSRMNRQESGLQLCLLSASCLFADISSLIPSFPLSHSLVDLPPTGTIYFSSACQGLASTAILFMGRSSTKNL